MSGGEAPALGRPSVLGQVATLFPAVAPGPYEDFFMMFSRAIAAEGYTRTERLFLLDGPPHSKFR